MLVPSDLYDHLIGQNVSEKYRIRSRIGSGGFGAVYSATNLSLGMEVAIKITRAGRDDARAIAEAKSAARLRSPHTVRVFDVGRLDDGTLYIVMEHLHGRSLRDYLMQEGPLPVDTAARWMGQACLALHEAHALGLVHRDVKPSNLFVVEGPNLEPHLKLLDFGLAKALSDDAPGDGPDQGKVVGSPPYMSPEQVRRARLTPQSDIWALGVVLYEALSGQSPFERDTASATLVAVAADPPRSLAALCPGLPAPLLEIVARCLMKCASERFPSASALKRALDALLGEGSVSRSALGQSAPSASPSTSPSTLFSATVEVPVRRRRYQVAGWLGAAALLSGVALLGSTPRTTAPTRAPVTGGGSSRQVAAGGATEEGLERSRPRALDGAPVLASVGLPVERDGALVATPPSAAKRVTKTRGTPVPKAAPLASSAGRRPSRLAVDPDF